MAAEKRQAGQWFFGEAETAVDAKGRVGIAQHLRKGFEDTVSVLYWEKDRLMLMPPENFELVEQLGQQLSLDHAEGVRNFFSSKARLDRRFFFGKKIDLELDPQGRLTIPKPIRDEKLLNPETDVVLIGCGEWVELLPKKHYLADCAQWEAGGGYEKLFSSGPLQPAPQSPSD